MKSSFPETSFLPIRYQNNQPQRNLVPVIFFDQAIVELAATDTEAIRRAGSVQVLGVDERFNQLDAAGTLPVASS